MVLLFFLFFFFIGGRPVTLGTDTNTYHEIYNTWSFGFFDSDLEFLFSILTTSLKFIDVSATFWIAFLSFIYLLLIFMAIYRVYDECAVVLLLVTSSLYFWLYGINIIRYGIAFSILLFSSAVYSSSNKKSHAFYIAIFSAIGFHVSILVQAACLIVFNRRISNFLFKFYWIFFIISFLFVIFNIDFLSGVEFILLKIEYYLPSRLLSRFIFYMDVYESNALNIGFSYLLSLSAVVLGAIYRNRIVKNIDQTRISFFELSFFFSVLNIIFLPLFYKYDTFARVLTGFDFFSVFLIYELFSFFFKRKLDRVIVISLFSLFIFYKVIYTGFINGFLNYRFY
ncbi:TPA: EpsG family protein [Vibrio cholerae]|uniref:EpsG family protein n=2 Tax=Vibrio cholerae TaxID=666 RepID=UPI0035E3FE99